MTMGPGDGQQSLGDEMIEKVDPAEEPETVGPFKEEKTGPLEWDGQQPANKNLNIPPFTTVDAIANNRPWF